MPVTCPYSTNLHPDLFALVAMRSLYWLYAARSSRVASNEP